MAHGIRQVNEIAGIAVNPVANMFPMMGDDEFKTLLEDIKERGCEEKIVVDTQGRIVDGRNRWKALSKLGSKWDEVPKTVRKSNDRELTAEVWSANFARRHLTAEQKGAAILLHQEQLGRIDKWEAEAKAEAESAKAAGKTPSKRGAKPAKLAKEAGISEATAEKVLSKRASGGKAALEEIVNGAGKERRGKGPREKARMPSNPEGLAEYLQENWTARQIKQLVELLTA